MREGHYLIIFFVVILVSMVALDTRANSLSVMTLKDESYDRGTEEAMQSAYDCALQSQGKTTVTLKNDFKCSRNVFGRSSAVTTFGEDFIDYFFKELYAKNYAYRNEVEQIRIQTAFPVIAFVDSNGITVNYIKQNAEGEIYRTFSEEIEWPSMLCDIKNCKQNSKDYYAYWEEIENTLNYFINNFGNRGTPLHEGISISLDRINSDELVIGDELIGIYAISLTEGAYDVHSERYRLANLNKIVLADFPYYAICKNKSSGILEYHIDTCDCITAPIDYKSSKDDCASYGAYPCAECRP